MDGEVGRLVHETGLLLRHLAIQRVRAMKLHEKYMDLMHHDGWAQCACPLAQSIRAFLGIEFPKAAEKAVRKEATRAR